MEFNEYQIAALRTASTIKDSDSGLICAALGLAGEAGEFADIIKKIMYHQHPYTKELHEKLCKEIGDVLWYCALGAEWLNVNLDDIAEDNIKKLKIRYPEGFDPEKSLKRYEKGDK